MSAHRDLNEDHSENKDTTDLSKEPDTPGGLGPQESNIDEEIAIHVGVRTGVLEPDTSSGLDLQESSIEETVDDEGDRPNIPPINYNYLHISKGKTPVNGQFILDLSLLPLPPSSGTASDTNNKNLTLHTTSGLVNAEIWIKHKPEGSPKSKRVSLDLCSDNGPVRAIVHDSDRSNRTLPFLNMTTRSNHGDVYLSLPRCFRGPITIRTRDDRIAFSPAFEKSTILISDVQGIRVYFVGDRPRGGKWGTINNTGVVEDLWDEISVDGKYTSVRINWVGEADVPFMPISPGPGFWGGAERFFTTGRIF